MSKKRRSIFGRSGVKKSRSPIGASFKTRKIRRGRNKGRISIWY